MKKLFLLFFILLSLGCKDDVSEYEQTESIEEEVYEHSTLGFELDEPETILNELAKGILHKNIFSIKEERHNLFNDPTGGLWTFEYIDNSGRVSKMTYSLQQNTDCEKRTYTFEYNDDNFISSIISIKKNICRDTESSKDFKFNYNENGLLKSIFTEDGFYFEEIYFGYYSNGKVKDIYTSRHYKYNPAYYYHNKFDYDSTFTNVIRMERFAGSQHYVYEYSYDIQKNPFKDFYLGQSLSFPSFGSAHLSENNVAQMVTKDLNSQNDYVEIDNYSFYYNTNNMLSVYSKHYNNSPTVYLINR